MSFHAGNTQFAEATIAELELNKETLRDLEVDGSDVKGGISGTSVMPEPGVKLNPTVVPTFRMTGTSVI